VLCGRKDQVQHIDRVVAEEQRTVPARDHVAGGKDWQARERHDNHHRDVEANQHRRNLEPARRNNAGDANDGQDVEQATADRVADGDVAFAAQRSHDRGRHLGQRCANGNDGQADDEFAHAEVSRERHSPLDQPIGTEHE